MHSPATVKVEKPDQPFAKGPSQKPSFAAGSPDRKDILNVVGVHGFTSVASKLQNESLA